MKNPIFTFIIVSIIILSFGACSKEDEEADAQVLKEAQEGATFNYLGTPTIQAAAGNSPHSFERVKFNSTAIAAFDSTGKLKAGNSFPEGGIILKELYSSANGSLNGYSIMKKQSSNKNAGSGWLWSEYKADGTVTFSTAKKGDGCISCHSGNANRDLIRIFDLR